MLKLAYDLDQTTIFFLDSSALKKIYQVLNAQAKTIHKKLCAVKVRILIQWNHVNWVQSFIGQNNRVAMQGFTKISFNDIDTNVYYFFHHFLEEKEQTVSWGIRPVSLQLLIDLTLGTP